jgi:hypothetical protein
MSERVQFWIGMIITLLCVSAVLWIVDLGQVLAAVQSANWQIVVLPVVVCQVAFMLLRAWRWRLMLGTRVRYWPLFHAQNVGYLITNLLPFRLGDLARSYLIGLEPGDDGPDMSTALSSVILERVLDVLIIIIFFGVAAPLAPALPGQMGLVGALFGGAAVAGFVGMLLAAVNRSWVLGAARWVLARAKRPKADVEVWIRRTDSFLDGFHTLTRWRLLLPVLGLSLVLWLCILVAYYVCLGGFWPGVTWPAALFTLCAAAFAVSAPSSPGFVGVFHGAVLLGLSVFPATHEQALGFAIVYHATMYLVILVLGLAGLWQSGRSLGSIVRATRNLGRA